MEQEHLSQLNKRVWTENVYEMWCRQLGTPKEYANKLADVPTIKHFGHLLGNVKGLKIANLMGSNCRKAVPLARLGADVTVVDISSENRRYGLEYAQAAGVELEYIVADILEWDFELGAYDWVLMEGGILHYFVSLEQIFANIHKMLRNEGQLLLSDYHPLRKVLTERDGLITLSGSYFENSLVDAQFPAAAEICSPDELALLPRSRIKPWKFDEIINAVIGSGLSIQKIEEYAWSDDAKLPQIFNLLTKSIKSDDL